MLLVGVVVLNSFHSLGVAQQQRIRENFDFDWMFHKGDIRIGRAVKVGKYGGLTDTEVKKDNMPIAYNDKDNAALFNPEQWRKGNLPHDWCVEGAIVNDGSISVGIGGSSDGLISHGFLPVGIGFYRKEFSIPATDEGKKISIEFDGIFRNSTVWVNGHLMGNHPSGYLPSCYDLTDVLRYGDEGKNVILVKVDASKYEGWWYEGCGIYRHVWLVKTDRLHVKRYGTYITTPEISEAKATVRMEITLQNEYNTAKQVKLVSKIMDMDERVLETRSFECSLEALGETEVVQLGMVDAPSVVVTGISRPLQGIY